MYQENEQCSSKMNAVHEFYSEVDTLDCPTQRGTFVETQNYEKFQCYAVGKLGSRGQTGLS